MPEQVLIETRHGKMWVFEGDVGCSNILRQYGEYSRFEERMIEAFVDRNGVALDVGAHIGAMTIPMAKMAKKVIAFEPQAEVREVLEANLKLAGVSNVEILPYALGFAHNRGYFTPNPESAGSVTIESQGPNEVEVIPMDDLKLEPAFIKMDIEGMEIEALMGARETLIKYKPYILLERQPKETKQLIQALTLLGYCSMGLDLPVYVKNNRNGNPVNSHPNMAHLMVLAVPGEIRNAQVS